MAMAMGTETATREDKPVATAGRISIYDDGAIAGPAEYLRSEAFARCSDRINNGTHVLISHAPAGTDPHTLVAVIIQTDYAAWAGMQDLLDTIKG